MTLRFSLTLPVLVLLMLAILTYWIERYVQPPEKQISKAKTHDPDYFMENFVTSKTDSHGKLRSMLAAVRLEHFADDQSLHLSRPRLTQFNQDGGYTQIEAQRGMIAHDGDHAEFYDHVLVSRPAKGESSELHMYTNYLKVLPKKNLATSTELVKITQGPHSYMTGDGMVYDKESREITLQKNVKIYYVKEKSQLPSMPLKKPKP